MRNNIVHSGADELSYEIREIVAVAQKIEALGQTITWENIGDPIAKGHRVPDWIKQIVSDIAIHDDSAYGYSPTKGLLKTRQFIADRLNLNPTACRITSENILFFNGLGDAIAHIYGKLNEHVRAIGPNPAYSTHSSAEASHASAPHITYKLDPDNNWLPDIEDLRNKVKYNPQIGGIIIINPDNPTGIVYPKEILRQIVDIAKEYDLFIIADEVYAEIVYGDIAMTPLAEVIGDVPGMALRGLSKEVPWPGSRCGWVEFYNTDRDPIFARYVKSLIDSKMLEVCSTTMPQVALPRIMSDKRYKEYIDSNNQRYNQRAELFYQILSKINGIKVVRPRGALYATVLFEKGQLTPGQKLPIASQAITDYVQPLVQDIPLDKRFVYYLLASTGVCVVPLSGFNSDYPGFRMTLLETDNDKYRHTLETIANAISKYLS
ncbi:pyridoxal phosphate-dependent aminotransferase [Candidatus Saccharibacteria bacterium]|nr:pyridoxal phosphate-dependent aminotransferase [Candidatus Saccharibacteria bacterium]